MGMGIRCPSCGKNTDGCGCESCGYTFSVVFPVDESTVPEPEIKYSCHSCGIQTCEIAKCTVEFRQSWIGDSMKDERKFYLCKPCYEKLSTWTCYGGRL